MFWKRGSLRPFLLGCALLFLGSGHSEKAVAAHFENHQSVEYIVEQGDTLSSIAQRYFDRISDMEAIAKRAGVSLSQPLHAGFHLNIPKAFLRREISTAVVSHISGPVSLFIHGKRGCLQQGQPVTEQMTIETGSSGFVTLLLPDGSHVSMPSMSQITITRLRKVALTGAVERSFKLEAGHVRVHATPLFRSDSYFHIATPSSLTAVRGTDFRVHYIENSKTHKKENIVEVLEGLVTTDNHKIVYAVPGGYGTNSIEKLDFPLNTPPSPSNRLTILRDAEPDIFLSKMPTASVYHAELSKDPDFSDLLSESWLDNTDVKLQGLSDGHYYLRLSAVDNHDLEGEEKVFPIDHKTGHLEASAYSFSEGAVFQWKIPDNEVVISRLQVVASKISETAIPIVDQLGGKTGLVKISSLPEGDYSWRIIAAWPAGGQIILPFRKLHISGNNPMKKMNDVFDSLNTENTARIETELKNTLVFEWSLLALAATLAVVVISWAGMTSQLDLFFYDTVVRLGCHKPDPSVLIVKIDDNALKTIAPWPWSPDKHAKFIKQLDAGHPLEIGYNVLFLDPSESQATENLSKTLKTSKTPIFLPMLVESGNHNKKTVAVLPLLAPSATNVGHVSVPFDRDGMVRRYWPALTAKGRYWPALVELMDNPKKVYSEADLREKLFSFDGPRNRFPVISAAAIWRNEVPPEFLTGKRILVGVTASGFEYLHPTPFGVMSGVEIQANILDTLLHDRTIHEASDITKLIVALVSLWILLIGFRFLSPRATILLTVTLGVGVPLLCAVLFLFFNYWFPPITSVVGVAFTYPFWAWSRLASLSKYFSDELEKLLSDFPEEQRQKLPDITAADPLEYKKQLLKLAISRIVFMRRFIADSLYYLPDVFFVTDKDNNIILLNKAAENLTAELGAQYHYRMPISTILNHLHNEEGHRINFDQVRNNEINSQCYAENGRAFDLRIAACRQVINQPDGWLIMLIDISAVKSAEEQRQRILHLLSHDMRSPQISILALIDRFSRTSCSKEKEAQEIITKISNYARRTLGLADNFTRLAQAEAPEYQWMDVEIEGVMTSAVDELWIQANKRQIKITLNDWEEPLFVEGDPALLERVFINLIDNAVKYSPDGSTVSCTVKKKEDQVEIAICDQGIGMDQEQIEALFRPFRRASTGPAAKISGIGLGLVFVNKVILRHHGHIDCRSTPGKGTCFIVTLPLMVDPE